VDRLSLVVLLVSGLVAVLLLATRHRRPAPPAPEPPPNVLRVDLEDRN
jgi:hypothetical protein